MNLLEQPQDDRHLAVIDGGVIVTADTPADDDLCPRCGGDTDIAGHLCAHCDQLIEYEDLRRGYA